VIIGGGVMGLSTAYHLARAGVTDVVLVEKSEFGAGSTCKAAGGVRAQFSDAVNIELGARSLHAFETFRATFDQEIDLHQVGYLFLLDNPEHVEAFEKNIALQNELGVPSRLIDVAEAKALSPLISTEGLLAAAYSPTDGHCTPESVVNGYARAARRAGARLVRNCAVTSIESSGGVIHHVLTDQGTIATDTVICAAGAWSRDLGAMVGVDLPVEPLRRQILVTEPMPGWTRTRRSPSTSPPRSTSTARAGACSWACPTRTRPRVSTSPSPTSGLPGSATPSSAAPPASARSGSPPVGPVSTK
jgi:sarcosine oxidase, subunit beta